MQTLLRDAVGKQGLIMQFLSEHYHEERVWTELQQEFAANDYVKLPGLIADQTFTHIRNELEYLRQFATKRSFIMEEYDTPREMHTLGGLMILKEAPTVWSLYCQHELRNLIQNIAGANVYSCLHPNEFMVANYLLCAGATHGWHLDDPAYALILILEASSAEDGGSLEFIQNWEELCKDSGSFSKEKAEPIVARAREANRVQLRHHIAGDAYFLRADRCLHQVTALHRDGVYRMALNLAFEAVPNPTYGNTANKLYGES